LLPAGNVAAIFLTALIGSCQTIIARQRGYMDRLKVTKLKITSDAILRLQHLRLTLADLNLIICFSRKLILSDATLYQFDSALAPVSSRPQLAHLTGLTLRAVSGQVVDVYRDSRALSIRREENDPESRC
jgi:hypothetical protein